MLLPGLPAASRGLVELVSLAQTTRLLASGGEAARFAMLRMLSVYGLDKM